MQHTRTDVSIFIPSFGDGGAERMMVNLARGLSEKDLRVDFLISRRQGPFLDSLGDTRVVELGAAEPRRLQRPLVAYFRKQRPRVFLSAKSCGQEALRVRRAIGMDSKLVVRVGTTVSRRVAGRNPVKRFKSFF